MKSGLGKSAVFIDGSNLYATVKALGFDVDYKKLRDLFAGSRLHYYTATLPEGEVSSIRPLLDWLDFNGYTVVTKPTKEFVDARGVRKVKGNMDIEVVIDTMELADHIDYVHLFSGDGDFTAMIHALHRKGCHVTVYSTIAVQPPMIADELRRAADKFVDLDELKAKIARSPETNAPRSKYTRE